MGGTRQDGILLTDDVGAGGGAAVSITSPLGSNLTGTSVSVTLATDEGPISVDLASPLVVAGFNPDYVIDPALIVASRDSVANATSTGTAPANRMLPVGAKDVATNTIRNIPITSTPWSIGAFGNPVALVREVGSGATQVGATALGVLNATIGCDASVNNVNSVIVVISNTAAFIGTITPRVGALDGVFRDTVAFKLLDGSPATTLALNTPYIIYTAGLYYFEARVTAYTSGGATGYLVGSGLAPVYGSVNVQDGGTSLTVDALNLDIRDLLFAADKVDVTGSSVAVSSLPAGVATSALQTAGNASLAQIDADLDVALSTRLAEATFTTRINTLGQKAMAASTPVTIASDQTSIPVAATLVAGGLVSSKIDLTPSAPTAVSVGIASGSAVAAAATRKGLILRNLSNNRISLGFGSAAVLDSGVTLYPRDTFRMDEYDFDIAAVNAIASAAASSLSVQEYLT